MLFASVDGLELFRDFLRTEFSEENIEFWIACEQFKNLHSNKIQNEAQKIYADYVAVQAPHEVWIIECRLRQSVSVGTCAAKSLHLSVLFCCCASLQHGNVVPRNWMVL